MNLKQRAEAPGDAGNHREEEGFQNVECAPRKKRSDSNSTVLRNFHSAAITTMKDPYCIIARSLAERLNRPRCFFSQTAARNVPAVVVDHIWANDLEEDKARNSLTGLAIGAVTET
mmetsp:Transcript_11977/g.20810  ORF Transcript_11977/g.20810 Transcript_11977/m.20810 type:complete len:116 (-) Transcript_11977:254-601(-)|eukprot:CAMPEP_0196653722 /NCGR_PEP_ID=MMETSP1086-20130531/3368_1 /TAXON_ID=77921 /ORGANISM="Cyanoptyche  gloeocystis , Strain SAG4.97" /LENGTH=115 /DNA_ID=CAMNT_0041985053 /DNA_START=296 /DNA_END=643 /DNA_ORIENTATION=+